MEDNIQRQESSSGMGGQGASQGGRGGCADSKEAGKTYWSNSRITSYQRCPRKDFYSYTCKRRTKKKNVNLIFGDILHKALCLKHTGKEDEVPALIASYVCDRTEKTKTREKLQLAYDTYVRENFPPVWQVLAVEEAIIWPLPSGADMIVIADMVVQRDGCVYGIEYKSTGRINDTFFERFKRDTQVDMQYLGIINKYGRCDGIYITAIEVGTAKVKIVRDLVTRTPAQLVRAEEYFVNWINTVQADRLKEENRIACFDFNSACEYLPVCSGQTTIEDDELYETKEEKVYGESKGK